MMYEESIVFEHENHGTQIGQLPFCRQNSFIKKKCVKALKRSIRMSIMKITINGIQFADIDMGKNLGVVNNFL